MALSGQNDLNRFKKARPKSCQIVRQKSEWKQSFENRKSIFEPPCSHPINRKCASAVILDKQSPKRTPDFAKV